MLNIFCQYRSDVHVYIRNEGFEPRHLLKAYPHKKRRKLQKNEAHIRIYTI